MCEVDAPYFIGIGKCSDFVCVAQWLVAMECLTCGCTYAVPSCRDNQSRVKGKKLKYYCPNGHPQWYVKATPSGESEIQMRRRMARLTHELDQQAAANESKGGA